MSFSTFSNLVTELGQTTKTNDKLALLRHYFSTASDEDKVWTIALFTGRRPRRFVSGTLMGQWCLELTGLPSWMLTECYGMVGDLSETIALLLPSVHEHKNDNAPLPSLAHILKQFNSLQGATEEEKKQYVVGSWQLLSKTEIFVFNKLMSANFRVGVSASLPVQALAQVYNLTVAEVAHRISGKWNPAEISFKQLIIETATNTDNSKPYPFYLAYPIEETPENLGEPQEWQAEWKWDGIRGQLIKRNNECFIWSRGEELITEKFPEFEALFKKLPNGTSLDGEIISLPPDFSNKQDNRPAAFAELQKRIGRKNLTKKILKDVPAGFIAYDLMEYNGIDIRQEPLEKRRRWLAEIFAEINDAAFVLSGTIDFTNWEALTQIRSHSREHGAEGIMLKRKSSSYGTGRRRGDWWKWKIDPLTIDAVMIYAQKGSGRRSNLYTDYTFAVRDGDKLVPFTKAYSGLTDKEFAQVDAFVKKNSIEKFGPVRTVKPELVFEIGFEGIAESKRHKSGVALRFPRMLRWRTDKKPEDINTLEDLKSLLNTYGQKS
ncbi:MAG: ATP-dependent DNA ligase [Chitinophagaceae bacterium]|nr:ATP-dependent DNA ligase [Chitinophagaceae bacterium]